MNCCYTIFLFLFNLFNVKSVADEDVVQTVPVITPNGRRGVLMTSTNNNNGQVYANFYRTCNGGNCQTCIDNKCYPRSYSSIKTYNNCPAVACEYNCMNFVISKDKCPLCQCNGLGTREPCNSPFDCSPEATCQNYLCTYKPLPENLPKACDFDFECKSNEECNSPNCIPDAKIKHVENVSCVFEHHCPKGSTCRTMTCYEENSQDHEVGVSCVFDYQCKSGYQCKNMSCFYTGRQHGSSMCVLPSSCNANEECVNMTCFPRG